ncbi:MAG TPA: hypothetical protein PKA06_09925 [Gemmatales bacterium]|nr:hypothetical protein [Gemmatales bacterium]
MVTIPSRDGQVLRYQVIQPGHLAPRIYYINGIQTTAEAHARTATGLSILTERPVYGVYNASAGQGAGIILDLLQCGADWVDIFLSKTAEITNIGINHLINKVTKVVRDAVGKPPRNPVNVADSIRQRIPEKQRILLIENALSLYNKATASLFQQLRQYRSEKQILIAHSQGNLITADALWSMVICYGEASLMHMQVYSLASPAPAWPLGIRYRRKVYGHTNDLVTLFDPHNWTFITNRLAYGRFGRTAADWRKHGSSWLPGLGGHDLSRNIALNFSRTIRKDLELPPIDGGLPAF